ncbi:unnamed protein product [Diatraea saccharalis]|uniref:Uncharacterized protein n=1 Tax=Diatraea saccharalis TaxID=40085 RepID=A0A9N9RHM0_9NEOP|nr:unnamed protein product [Diatraea saccharalis]
MWWLGSLFVMSVVFGFSSSADFEYIGSLQRLRRSPHYHCPPYFYDSQPRQYPGPPPFWPPPPPPRPYFQERQNYQNEPQPKNFDQNPVNQPYNEGQPLAKPQNSQGEITDPDSKPCDQCDKKGHDTAISNAKSVSGSAVAVAIAGKGNNT